MYMYIYVLYAYLPACTIRVSVAQCTLYLTVFCKQTQQQSCVGGHNGVLHVLSRLTESCREINGG